MLESLKNNSPSKIKDKEFNSDEIKEVLDSSIGGFTFSFYKEDIQNNFNSFFDTLMSLGKSQSYLNNEIIYFKSKEIHDDIILLEKHLSKITKEERTNLLKETKEKILKTMEPNIINKV